MIRILPAITAYILSLCCLLTGCGSGGGAAGAGIAQEPATNPEPFIKSIRDIGVVRENPLILKRDCGISARYAGRSIWLFGDTLLENPNAENVKFLSNSWSTTYDIDAGDGIEGFSEPVDALGAPVAFFPLTEEEKAFNKRNTGEFCAGELNCSANWHIWPGTMVVDQKSGWAYVFYRKVLVDGIASEFRHVGHSLAVWRDYSAPRERPVFNYVESFPTLFFSEEGEPGFGSAAVVVAEDVYVYGCELGADQLSKPCYVARVPLADILDKSAWSFYGGAGKWSLDSLESQIIFHGNDMMSVFFNSYINRFVAIYSEPLGSTAMLRTAERPEGPWSIPTELFTVDASDNIYGWVYDFLAHPEFSQDDGKTIYLTYSRNTDQIHSELRLVAIEFGLSR